MSLVLVVLVALVALVVLVVVVLVVLVVLGGNKDWEPVEIISFYKVFSV